MAIQPVDTIKIFFCYAHEDDDLRKQLAVHLIRLRRLRYITGWFDRDIEAGTDWAHEIENRLDAASIILLLVSADFIASDYCYTVEMQRALEKQKAGTAHVIPIILRPAMWEFPPLSELQVLPTGKKPITQWADRDEAWLNVAQGISELVKTLLSRQRLSLLDTMILNPDVLDQLGQPPIITPPPVHAPRETRVLLPTQPDQSGQPSAPVVPPPLMYLSQETRVLPPNQPSQPRQSPFVPLSPLTSHPPHLFAPLLREKNLFFIGFTLVTLCILVIIGIHVIPTAGKTSTPLSATQSTLTATTRPTIPATATLQPQSPNTTTVSHLVKKWIFSFQRSSGSVSLPATANNMVYTNSQDGYLHALDATTGVEKWHFPPPEDLTDLIGFPDRFLPPPMVVNNIVYITSQSDIYAIDARTGAKKWAFGSAMFNSLPTIANNILYITSSFSTLYALDAATGTQKWRFQTGDLGNFSPTVVNNMVYTDSNAGQLVALDAATGQQKWEISLGNYLAFPQLSSWPTVSTNVIFALVITSNNSSNLYAIDAMTGTPKRPPQMINGLVSSLVVANGGIYIGLENDPGSSNFHLIAFDAVTGTQKWPSKTLTASISVLLVANDNIYIDSSDSEYGNLYAFDATTGQQKWFVGNTSSTFDVNNNIVYINSFTNNTFDALDATTGKEKWHFQVVNTSFSSSIVINDVVYAVATSNSEFALYAFSLS